MEVSGQLQVPVPPPKEWVPGTHWRGGSLGPRAVLETVVNRTNPYPCREANMAVQSIA
jgi:hypothetical protein